MEIKLTTEERKALLEILECEIQLSADDMGEKLEDQIKQGDWTHIVAEIYRRLKKVR